MDFKDCLMWFADESGFYYHTAAANSVYKLLKNNPRVEICKDPQDKILRSNSHNLCH
jgi:uncharacterized pyridoxamine 5'-phosphate oxidase family protein